MPYCAVHGAMNVPDCVECGGEVVVEEPGAPFSQVESDSFDSDSFNPDSFTADEELGVFAPETEAFVDFISGFIADDNEDEPLVYD